MKKILFVFVLTAGCWCDVWGHFCGEDPGDGGEVGIDTLDTGSEPPYSCDDIGPEGACLCPCDEDNIHYCPPETCVYIEDADETFIACNNGPCRLFCDPGENPDGCLFDNCDDVLLDCSHYGWACGTSCPNTK